MSALSYLIWLASLLLISLMLRNRIKKQYPNKWVTIGLLYNAIAAMIVFVFLYVLKHSTFVIPAFLYIGLNVDAWLSALLTLYYLFVFEWRRQLRISD